MEEFLGRKMGPLPIWSWLMIAGGLAMIMYRVFGIGKPKTDANGNPVKSPGQGTMFQSSQTQTGTDAQGQQYQNSFSAQGDGYLPGMITNYGYPMPFSGGDVYVNYPAPTNTTSPAPSPSGNAPTIANSRTVTTQRDSYIQDLVHDYIPVAGWGATNNFDPRARDSIWNPRAPYDIWSGAIEGEEIIQDNPGIDWSKEIPSGTQVNIPPGIGVISTSGQVDQGVVWPPGSGQIPNPVQTVTSTTDNGRDWDGRDQERRAG